MALLEVFFSEHEQVILLILYHNHFIESPHNLYVPNSLFKKIRLVLPKNIIEGSLDFLAEEGCITGRIRLGDKWRYSPVRITSLGIKQFRLVDLQQLKKSKTILGNTKLEKILTLVEEIFHQIPTERNTYERIKVINYGQITESPLTLGSSNIVQSHIDISVNDIEKVKRFIDLIKVECQNYDLDAIQKLEIESDIKSLESQIASPKPKVNILKELGRHILDVVKPVASQELKELANSVFGGT